MQILAVPLVAFACLTCCVLVGASGPARGVCWPALQAAAGTLRLLACGVVMLAVAALGVVTFNTRAEFRHAETQMARFADDVAALDSALRAAGPAGETARMLVFRFAEGMSRQLYVQRAPIALADPEPLTAVRAALGREVAGVAAQSAAAALAPGRFETLTRSAGDLLAAVPPPGVKMCRPIIVGWMMAGLGLMALLGGNRAGTLIGLVALAAVLALGVFYLEELAHPFAGRVMVSPAVLEDALHAISE